MQPSINTFTPTFDYQNTFKIQKTQNSQQHIFLDHTKNLLPSTTYYLSNIAPCNDDIADDITDNDATFCSLPCYQPFNDNLVNYEKLHAELLKDNQAETTNSLWLMLSKQSCLQLCRQHNFTTTEFAHWLAIIDLGILLVFRQQCCIAVQKGVL